MENKLIWQRSTPGLLVIMLDSSDSMMNEACTKYYKHAVNFINESINALIQRVHDGKKPIDRLFVVVVGYTSNIFPLTIGYLSDLDSSPKRVEKRVKKFPDGYGGLVDCQISYPVWVEPLPDSSSSSPKSYSNAFEFLEQLFIKWHEDKPNHPAPIALNITCGQAINTVDMNNTIRIAEKIHAMDFSGDKAQLYNIVLGEGQNMIFPSDASCLTTDMQRFFYKTASSIDLSVRQECIMQDFAVKTSKESKGVVYCSHIPQNLIGCICPIDMGDRRIPKEIEDI